MPAPVKAEKIDCLGVGNNMKVDIDIISCDGVTQSPQELGKASLAECLKENVKEKKPKVSKEKKSKTDSVVPGLHVGDEKVAINCIHLATISRPRPNANLAVQRFTIETSKSWKMLSGENEFEQEEDQLFSITAGSEEDDKMNDRCGCFRYENHCDSSSSPDHEFAIAGGPCKRISLQAYGQVPPTFRMT
ncbi:hypothetical protein AXG93_2587s1700 [Marchantia polymorpha subsp. ruderalis]|uniref:Uncharacterized protein n=1 Tax=Marchantia polymorpha subsp. ruderalis TaxID=1480154 RepID=A0A176WRI9_MARPO|nr:hypothetical protein AXG93_2587s1700 [Marchantia polymorpha subsp. ruderalis]